MQGLSRTDQGFGVAEFGLVEQRKTGELRWLLAAGLMKE